ncbi:GIY-YIG nuclease family protein [Lactobacillus sp. 3B(2020)]|uniref:GIY-YIG nuclease family protein n=1 Tax=Lactobacillus sp. 3B(2020) TaxID=2695882 RepID=UPI0015DEA653|nr:GIY-YIG nuclease family protein [Lactobacillus sp. 3B(2020)]QLL70425.1 GIY-YIG nuclease family protein [Lactobacillus sp. 3B(2020)]
MASRQYRTLDDIFSDPELDEILKPLEKKPKLKAMDPDVHSFEEVQDWVREHGRKPENTRSDLTERRMFHRLKGMQKKYDKLHDYDELGLLVAEDKSVYKQLAEEVKKDTNTKSFNTLDDVLNDDSILFDDLDNIGSDEPKFFDTEKVTRKQDNNPDAVAQRQKMDNFDEYKQMFRAVQKDIASGRRQLLPFRNYEILLHHFYVLRGQLIYIEAFGEDIQKDNKNGSYKDKRVHVIYENGTENNVLFRGLGSSLYGRGGKIVSEPENDDIKLTADDYETGYIYVLKSLSKDPQISEIKSLYKIGFTASSVKKRIANAENEPTYLYAPVKLIEQFQVINLDPEALETAIHHTLANYRLDVDIKAPNGRMITPREWFVVDLPKVEEIINTIVARLQSEQ